jgi:hypothetical protein
MGNRSPIESDTIPYSTTARRTLVCFGPLYQQFSYTTGFYAERAVRRPFLILRFFIKDCLPEAFHNRLYLRFVYFRHEFAYLVIDSSWELFRILYASGVVTRSRAPQALGRGRGTRYAAERNEEERCFYAETNGSMNNPRLFTLS